MFVNFHSCARLLPYLLRRAHRCFTAHLFVLLGVPQPALFIIINILELTLHLCPMYSRFMTKVKLFVDILITLEERWVKDGLKETYFIIHSFHSDS